MSALGREQHLLARRRQAENALALAREDRNAEFSFELDDRFRDARLRRVQGTRRGGDVEFVARRFAQEAELLQVHLRGSLVECCRRPRTGGREV